MSTTYDRLEKAPPHVRRQIPAKIQALIDEGRCVVTDHGRAESHR